ncbi:hypothetical protein DFH28DRAFT_903740 [Melampsora americana]|nr:hypothetical protein DFH28DRAFT_903740 [Melampsora americana]
MAQHLDRHIEILLPALASVNSNLNKDIGGLVWYLDERPFKYLDFNMPRFPQPPNPRNSPYARRPAPSSTVTPSRVTSSSRPSSCTGTPRVTSNSRPNSSGNQSGHTSGTSNSPANTSVARRPKTVVVCDPDDHECAFGHENIPRSSRHRSDVYLYFDVSLFRPSSYSCLNHSCINHKNDLIPFRYQDRITKSDKIRTSSSRFFHVCIARKFLSLSLF